MMLAAVPADDGGFGALGILAIVLYFLPTICGWRRDNRGAIFALNLFLGWTVIGWVAALVWALTVDRRQTTIVQAAVNPTSAPGYSVR